MEVIISSFIGKRLSVFHEKLTFHIAFPYLLCFKNSFFMLIFNLFLA
ncbi:hypothetical protein PrebiDRAFT_2230 [Prevotella bivia DSM 20514]|uniref:Uncharacterized protein n=1 Tax=Prevotella bivia DSM 20514 TaxID=868129 RepID=I4ZCD6_9BACT|nr:hypothetical protein PrebiDRAFT_2230 [Prevotella bivia DSM 20514]